MGVTISVVIPCRDDAPLLVVALDALRRQTRAPDEIVVVDNGSSDDTVAVATAAGARVVDEPVQGILRATAAGFDAAVGDVLARIDADSVPPVDWLARVEAAFEGPDAPTALSGPGRFYGIGPIRTWAGEHLYLGGYRVWMGLFLGHPPLFGSNMAIRREAWMRIRDAVHRSDRRLHDDLDIAYHLAPDMSVRFDPGLAMPISGRPFHSLPGLGRRLSWAARTIVVNTPGQWPWQRRARRRALRRRRGPAGRTQD